MNIDMTKWELTSHFGNWKFRGVSIFGWFTVGIWWRVKVKP